MPERMTEIQLDFLTEIFNIGVGKAAAALSHMVEEEVHLSIPRVEFLSAQELLDRLLSFNLSEVSALRERFKGILNGEAILLFSADNGERLVSILHHGEVSASADGDVNKVEYDTLTEVGNVLLNSCIASLADMWGTELDCSLVSFFKGDFRDLLSNYLLANNDKQGLMFLHVDFELKETSVDGNLLFVLNLARMHQMLASIDHLVGNLQS